MKKIMFNEHYGLETATLNGSKTRTSRIVPQKLIDDYMQLKKQSESRGIEMRSFREETIRYAKYWFQEKVAISQAYKNVFPNADFEMIDGRFITESAGWNNKMFVKAEYMPHQIKIIDIKIKRLQDISYYDCMKEGIKMTIGKENRKYGYYFGASFSLLNCFETPREAFAHLIDKVSGKGTWDKNPWVLAYYYRLIK